jgi:pilus assembly protein FimV
MNRSLKLSMLMALALGSSQLLALDLGHIEVKSALGQPLLAEIPLHPANPGELRHLTVQLAPSEDFVRAGISGGRTSIPLQFTVASGANGQQVIRITSSVAVNDPYLDLLLEVSSSSGKSVQEFTILLDPPGTMQAAAPASAPKPLPMRESASRAAVAPPAPPPRAAPARRAAPPAELAGNGKYGPVEYGQTLSSIARRTAPAGVDVYQMLLALKQANPDAFYRDNINALKSGVVLRVPTANEAQSTAAAAAVAEVRRQNSDWRAGTTRKAGVVADAATRASTSSSPSGATDSTEDRLALVPAKDGHGAAGQGSAAETGSSGSARQELLRTQESLASLQQQSTDLKSRLKDLADINSRNERLLSLKDNEIADLQAKLAAARKAAGLPATAMPAAAGPATAGSNAVADAAPVAPVRAATATADGINPPAASAAGVTKPVHAASTPVSGVAPAAKARSKPAIHNTQAISDGTPWYMQAWAMAVGAGIIVLLILLAMLGRRRKPVTAASPSPLSEHFISIEPTDRELSDSEDADQEELLDQLAEHPDDIGLHLELVSLYYARRDVEHFEAAAEAMHAHIVDPGQEEWQDVVQMGEDLVPGHPLFDHHVELPVHEDAEARRVFDIDDYAGEEHPAAPEISPPPLPVTPKPVGEYHFDFDLNLTDRAMAGMDNVPGEAAAESSAVPSEEVVPAPASGFDPVWQFDTPEPPADAVHELGAFNDDPVDTKLDLARAYLDMGDAEGARAMLDEVLKEGSQMQRDVASRLLESLE